MAVSSGSVVSNNINLSKQTIAVQNSDSPKDNKLQNVMEPIFVDDFQNEEYPRSVQNILKFLEVTEPHAFRNDVLVGLIYVLMLETGFRSTTCKHDDSGYSFNFRKHLEYTKKLPDGWKKDGTYKFSFILENFEENECVVMCCSSLDDLLVNCCIKGVDDSCSLYLDTLTYFSSSNVNVHKVRLQNLRGLSSRVKQSLCNPAKGSILRHNSRLSQPLDILPDEMIVTIMDYLKTTDFVRFGMTCKSYYKIMSSPLLWFRRLIRDFSLDYDPSWQTLNHNQIVNVYRYQRNIRDKRYLLNMIAHNRSLLLN